MQGAELVPKISSLAAVACIFLSMSGCARKVAEPAPVKSAVSLVEERIRDAAERISKDMS